MKQKWHRLDENNRSKKIKDLIVRLRMRYAAMTNIDYLSYKNELDPEFQHLENIANELIDFPPARVILALKMKDGGSNLAEFADGIFYSLTSLTNQKRWEIAKVESWAILSPEHINSFFEDWQ